VSIPTAAQRLAFERSLAVGRVGEDFLLTAHPELRRPKEGERRWDLEGAFPDGSRRTVEVKYDTYPMLATPNFFMEVGTTVDGRFIIGGPWRAARDGVSELAYLFINGGKSLDEPGAPTCWWFRDVPALVAALDAMRAQPKGAGRPEQRRVRSAANVSASGLLVPRASVAALAECITYEPAGEPDYLAESDGTEMA
jgi:hypothetical protein